MVDECSLCAEQRSVAVVQDDLILSHSDYKEMDLCPSERFSF